MAPTGAFTVSSSFGWDLSRLYTTGEVTLTAAGGLVLGDFNGNSVVDADDLASWKTGFGTTGNATCTQGDADCDHDVDGADFLAWQRRFGVLTPVVTANASVPSRRRVFCWRSFWGFSLREQFIVCKHPGHVHERGHTGAVDLDACRSRRWDANLQRRGKSPNESRNSLTRETRQEPPSLNRPSAQRQALATC